MSDGTLRVLGLLLAVYQPGPYSVVAVEEPEATVNPAVAEVVVEVLMDAAHEKQVLLTSHSPDILDYKELTDTQIRVVAMEHGRTLWFPRYLQLAALQSGSAYTRPGNCYAQENYARTSRRQRMPRRS